LLRRFAALPDTFPHTKRYAAELTSGTALDRFGFTLILATACLQESVPAREAGKLGTRAGQPESRRPKRIEQVPGGGFR
jgi:hypothetical protein